MSEGALLLHCCGVLVTIGHHHAVQGSHVGQQDAFELEDGLVVHHDGPCMLWMLLPVDLVVCVLPLLLLELVHITASQSSSKRAGLSHISLGVV